MTSGMVRIVPHLATIDFHFRSPSSIRSNNGCLLLRFCKKEKGFRRGTEVGQGVPGDECVLFLVNRTGVYDAVGASEGIDVHVRARIRGMQGYPTPGHGLSG